MKNSRGTYNLTSGVTRNELHWIMILEPVEASRNSFVPAITALHCLSAASTSLQKQLSIGERKNYGNADLLQKQILCQLILLHQALSIVPRRYTYYITLSSYPQIKSKMNPNQINKTHYEAVHALFLSAVLRRATEPSDSH